MSGVPPPVEHTTTIAAFAGGALWAMASLFISLFGPTAPDGRGVLRAFVEAAFSIVAAGIGGYFVAPGVCVYLRIHQMELVSLVGLTTGLLFWKLIPLAIDLGQKAFEKIVSVRFGMEKRS